MCVSARNEMRKKIVCFAVRIMLVISMLTTAYAATSIPKPIWCLSCGTTNIVKVGTMWTTSNLPQSIMKFGSALMDINSRTGQMTMLLILLMI